MPWIDRARGIGPLFRAVPCPAILVLATSLLVSAQTPPPPPAAVPQFAVVIDAAHGGTDTGAHLTEQLEEKDLVLALSVELRSMLSAHGILVTTTREMDVDLSPLRRAEIANHRGAAVCILLHATASGHGVHLFTSSLSPASPTKFLPWDTAQAAYVQSSLRLSSEINSALTHAEIPLTLGRTYLLPMDHLTCPAVAVEVAPLGRSLIGKAALGSTGQAQAQPTPVTDPGYQKRIVSALVAAIEEWKHDVAGESGGSAGNGGQQP
jgi:N-acetylmuramoyl-L-alanine amidase